ncbi:MAG: T9SS type A sorting domain-containing protein [Bacteroidia bacterium]
MKTKILSSVIALLAFAGTAFSQNGNGVTTYAAVSNNASYYKFNNRTSFVIDNLGNKYIGYAYPVSSTNVVRLSKFDNSSWHIFPYYFASNEKIYAVAVDASNNIWVGTNYGLYKFQDTTYVATYNTGNSSIISNTITCIEAGNGKVYIGTSSGLSVFNGSTFTNYNHVNNGMKSDTVLCIKYENPGSIWIGNKRGLDKFDGSSVFTYSSVVGASTDSVLCIYIDGSSNKWIGTNHSGVIKYDNLGFYTMPQLYGTPINVNWPVHSPSVCNGPSGGVFFQSTHYNYPTSPVGSSVIEITPGGQVIPYNGIGYSYFSGTAWTSYDIFQYDYVSNKVYYTDVSPGTNNFLHSFNTSEYVSFYPSPSSSQYLDINNVQALINPNSDLFWDMQSPKYFVPKGTTSSPLFAASLWMGGFVNSSLRAGAMTYRQNGMDFWPGPLDTTNASIDTATSLQYNRVWKVDRFDIANFIYNWGAGNVQNGTFIVPPSIVNWPAHGTGNYSRDLAPFVDVNGDGIYNPLTHGDYPRIKGDQMIWWVFNDKLSRHSETGGAQMGIQVKASAYAYACPNIADSNRILNYTTFYDYKITNYSTDRLDSFYVAPWMDTGLGDESDDYIGCSVMGNYGFVYNGDNYDQVYGDRLPAFSCNILNGPMANPSDGIDNNNNGVIDEANEKCLMYSFQDYFNSGCTSCGNPIQNSPMTYYNYMRGIWRDGTPMTYGGAGFTYPTNQKCRHIYPGNSDPYGISMGGSVASPVTPTGSYGSTGWTQPQAGVVKNDMRFIIGVGPFTVQPGGTYEVEYALAFSQDSINCIADSICILVRQAAENNQIRNWYANNSFPSCLSLNGVGVRENKMAETSVKIYPNPTTDNLFVEFNESKSKVTVEIYDILGNIVKAGTFNDARKYIVLPVADITPGIYSAKITHEGTTLVKKFVKQ